MTQKPERKPRKRTKRPKTPKTKTAPIKQKQSQRQSVVVNIGTQSQKKPRKKQANKRDELPPPSYQHNLAPTFIQPSQQTDYTPLIMSLLQDGRVRVKEAIGNPVTPLSVKLKEEISPISTPILRREGKTASNLQVHPSKAREEIESEIEREIKEMSKMAIEDIGSTILELQPRKAKAKVGDKPPSAPKKDVVFDKFGDEVEVPLLKQPRRPTLDELRSGRFEGSTLGDFKRAFPDKERFEMGSEDMRSIKMIDTMFRDKRRVASAFQDRFLRGEFVP